MQSSCRIMVSFAGPTNSRNLLTGWMSFLTDVMMKDEIWPTLLNIWDKKDPTWGWITTSYGIINQDTIDLLYAVMTRYDFEITIENDSVMVCRPINPSRVPTYDIVKVK